MVTSKTIVNINAWRGTDGNTMGILRKIRPFKTPVWIVCLLVCMIIYSSIKQQPQCTNVARDSEKGSRTSEQKEKNKNIDEKENYTPRTMLDNAIPTTLFYVWCGQRIFTFEPYMAIKSAIRALQPSSVIILTDRPHPIDTHQYHQWMEDLRKEITFVRTRGHTEQSLKICNGTIQSRRNAIISLLESRGGGIYIGENTWILNIPPENFKQDFEIALEKGSTEGYVILRKGVAKKKPTIEGIIESSANKVGKIHNKGLCLRIDDLNSNIEESSTCLILDTKKVKQIYPKDFINSQSKIAEHARNALYGSKNLPILEPDYDNLVPNIGHVVFFCLKPISFMVYLSILSYLYVLELDKVYVHSECEPYGPYWEKLRANKKIGQKLIYVQRQNLIYFHDMNVIEGNKKDLRSVSDIVRYQVLIEYGGYYADMDALWTKPFSKKQRAYEAAVSIDWCKYHSFPRSINLGVVYAKPNSRYLKYLLEAMLLSFQYKHTKDFPTIYHSIHLPYKIWEKHPETLHFDPNLQVMCFKGLCHPVWEKGFEDEKRDHRKTGSLENWRDHMHAIHFTYPDPDEFKDEETLMGSTGLFADIGKMVLSKAGLI